MTLHDPLLDQEHSKYAEGGVGGRENARMRCHEPFGAPKFIGKRNRGGRPFALGGRPSALNGYPWTAVWQGRKAVYPQREPLDGRLARVDDRLPPNGSFWTAICLKQTTVCSFFV
ncbi:unnamed protein product, partial [Sphenostylis stenocarpa]